MTLQSLIPMDFIKDANNFDCDNDGTAKKIGINKTVTNYFKILEKESPASSAATSNTAIQICTESLDEFLQTNDFEDVSRFYVNLNYLFVNKLYLNLKHIIIDHDVLLHNEDLQKNYQSCSMIRPDLEEVQKKKNQGFNKNNLDIQMTEYEANLLKIQKEKFELEKKFLTLEHNQRLLINEAKLKYYELKTKQLENLKQIQDLNCFD
ncbi:hypothetical protein QTP88_018972 [Uroleucon formosanum]